MSHTLLSKSKSGQGRCSHTRGLTLPSRGRVPAGFARFHTPLTSNVRPHHTTNMSTLALKVPPPIAAAILAAAMWLISSGTVALAMPTTVRISLVVLFAIAGAGFSLAGAIAFRQAKTTVNPMKPENASSLVVSGVYRITRNPMYVGLLLMLVAWCVLLSAPWAIAGPVAFFLYIGKFQIAPEEQVMSQKFGTDYLAYKARVRRWL